MTYKYIITQSLAMLMSLASNAFEVKSGQMVVVSADTARMEPVAKTALKMLKGDIRKVLGSEMKLVNTARLWAASPGWKPSPTSFPSAFPP